MSSENETNGSGNGPQALLRHASEEDVAMGVVRYNWVTESNECWALLEAAEQDLEIVDHVACGLVFLV
tara:strand:- start:121 stop:324 length:204 start_codon:yes stop_codon:yes gene_type:complete